MDYVFITGRRKDVLDRAVAEIGRNRVGMAAFFHEALCRG